MNRLEQRARPGVLVGRPDWLDAMLFAGVNMAAEVDGFYHGLNEEQKAKLDKLDL